MAAAAGSAKQGEVLAHRGHMRLSICCRRVPPCAYNPPPRKRRHPALRDTRGPLDGPGTKISSAPFLARNGALLVGIGRDEAGVHREPFAAHQALAQAAFHHGLEQVPQDVALPEPTMAVA